VGNTLADPKNERGVLLGISDVGKTFLLGALYQASLLSGADGFILNFIPRMGDSNASGIADLIREMISRITRGDVNKVKATTKLKTYLFRIDCQTTFWRDPLAWFFAKVSRLFGRGTESRVGLFGWPNPGRALEFEILDSPGGTQFADINPETDPQRYEEQQKIIKSLGEANFVIVCVDASAPQLSDFTGNLPYLLAKAIADDRRLKPARLLLLLTKIDVLAQQLIEGVSSLRSTLKGTTRGYPALDVIGDLSALQIATMIDPLDTARSVLGQAPLSQLRRSLDQHSEMAIGICSSTGFHENGTVFWSGAAPRLEPGVNPDDAYKTWTPFGVQEIIQFLTRAHCGSTIQKYTWRDDLEASRRRGIPLELFKAAEANRNPISKGEFI